ncbi:MAG TPA: hypothetical protein VLF38_00300 [Nocardioides sp.]|nr:hypothetical protein [Nocardioides sp.]HSX65949.1 hypothetical protein [Nocardioides sp.]
MEFTKAGLLISKCFMHVRGHEFGEVARQLDGRVVLDDVVFDELGGQVRQVAQPLLLVDADEVLVLAAVTRRPRVDELASLPSLLAAEAVELLLEVVEVGTVAPSRGGPLRKDLLNERELFGGDDRLVAAREQFALVAHKPHVIRVGEHRVPLTDGDLVGPRVAPGRTDGQAAVVHLAGQSLKRVVAGRVQLEAGSDVVRARLIDRD